MIGDLRLVMSKFIKQQVTCKHAYESHVARSFPYMIYKECVKCGRSK